MINTCDIQSIPDNKGLHVNSLQQGTYTNVTKSTKEHDDRTELKQIDFHLSNSELTEEQKQDLLKLLHEYRDCFATSMDEIGCTHLISHSIDTTDDIPVRSRPYRVSSEMKKVLEKEVQTFLDNDILQVIMLAL